MSQLRTGGLAERPPPRTRARLNTRPPPAAPARPRGHPAGSGRGLGNGCSSLTPESCRPAPPAPTDLALPGSRKPKGFWGRRAGARHSPGGNKKKMLVKPKAGRRAIKNQGDAAAVTSTMAWADVARAAPRLAALTPGGDRQRGHVPARLHAEKEQASRSTGALAMAASPEGGEEQRPANLRPAATPCHLEPEASSFQPGCGRCSAPIPSSRLGSTGSSGAGTSTGLRSRPRREPARRAGLRLQPMPSSSKAEEAVSGHCLKASRSSLGLIWAGSTGRTKGEEGSLFSRARIPLIKPGPAVQESPKKIPFFWVLVPCGLTGTCPV